MNLFIPHCSYSSTYSAKRRKTYDLKRGQLKYLQNKKGKQISIKEEFECLYLFHIGRVYVDTAVYRVKRRIKKQKTKRYQSKVWTHAIDGMAFLSFSELATL